MKSAAIWRSIGAWAIGAAIGLAADGAHASVPDIQGSWMSGCYVEFGRHLKKDLYIISSQIYSSRSLYSDTGCFNLVVKLEEVQGYVVEASNQVAGASAVDLVAQRSFLTVFDASTARLWDQAKFCGISDWDVGIPRDVTGRSCGGHAMPKAGDKEFDLYLRDGYSKLWIGLRSASLDGSAPDKRPRELDRTVGFRQLAD
jgi:hypothetical protein